MRSRSGVERPGNRNILLLSQCHDADTPARSPRQAGLPPLPIISILCSSAQDGGAGSGKGRNSEYVGAGAGLKMCSRYISVRNGEWS